MRVRLSDVFSVRWRGEGENGRSPRKTAQEQGLTLPLYGLTPPFHWLNNVAIRLNAIVPLALPHLCFIVTTKPEVQLFLWLTKRFVG